MEDSSPGATEWDGLG